MEKFILPPSPSWNLSNVLACNDDGVLAFGSRSEVVIVYFKSQSKFDVKFISKAHKERINVLAFSPTNGSFKHCLATCGDDGIVRLWDFHEQQVLYSHSGHKDGLKVVGLDWSRGDTNRIVSVNDLGSIVCWDLASNSIRKLHCGVRVLPLCLACCPHDQDIVAVGCKVGVTLVINIKGTGKILHRLRGNEQDVISLSWCPVSYNVIKHKREDKLDQQAGGDCIPASVEEKPRELLLATGGTDKYIYLWRTSSDGRFEVVLNLPNCPINFNQKRKGGLSGLLPWVALRWVDAYTLLSTSSFGELLSWDLNKMAAERGARKLQPQLVHSKHNKGCFSIACPINYGVENKKEDQRIVWTTAMDKHIVACSLSSQQVLLNIPTVGGGIFSLATSPLDPNRVAIGSSDNKIFVWNMSSLHSLDISSYWRKIVGKVMALSWHPTEENWLAFGTGDGHVGVLDVDSTKLPTLFRLHHRRAVYRVVWAPAILPTSTTTEPQAQNDEGSKENPAVPELTVTEHKLALYSVADGDIWQYSAQKPDEEPKSLNEGLVNSIDKEQGQTKKLTRSELVFKPDNTAFGVASDNGSIYVIGRPSLSVEHVITYAHKKCINHLEWHPQTVASENSLSPYRHWLASASENIKVYNVPPAAIGGQVELVATLSSHSEKVVAVAWSPHYNARLLSASYDYSVRVWDVATQTCLGVSLAHSMAAMCALFSPMDADSVITGSLDNTVRLISVANMPTSVKIQKRKERVGVILKGRDDAEEATELTIDEESANGERRCRSASSSPTHNSAKANEDYKKRQKNRAVFSVTGPKLINAKHFDTYFERWMSSTASGESISPSSPTSTASEGVAPDSGESERPVTPSSSSMASEKETPSAPDLGYLDFFGDGRAMRRLLMVEESRLKTNSITVPLQQTSALWRGDVSQMIEEAIAKKKLSEWLVSMAPIAGFDVWEQACSAYAEQLVDCGDIVGAANYLLAIHRAHDAVTLLTDNKHYREAIAVAKCRLTDDDPLVNEIYKQWGSTARAAGSTSLAAHCFLAAGQVQDCIDTLAKGKDLKLLESAANVARHTGLLTLADQLTTECLTLCMHTPNLPVARHLLAFTPQFQYWEVWLRARQLLTKVKNRDERELFDWLENGRPAPSLWQELATVCSADPTVYDKLIGHLPTNKTPGFERDMWMYVSGQLGAASAAGWPSTQALRHTVSALSAAFHFQTLHTSSLALPYIASLMCPKGLFAEDSILNIDKTDKQFKEVKLLSSLKAFICASIVHWICNNWEKVNKLVSSNDNKHADKVENNKNGVGEGSNELKEFKMNWLPELLENCSSDVLNAENVTFFLKKSLRRELQNDLADKNIQKTIVKNQSKNENKSKKKKSSKNNKSEQLKTEGISVSDPKPKSDGIAQKKLDENLNITNGKKEIINTNTTTKDHMGKQISGDNQPQANGEVRNKSKDQNHSETEKTNNSHDQKEKGIESSNDSSTSSAECHHNETVIINEETKSNSNQSDKKTSDSKTHNGKETVVVNELTKLVHKEGEHSKNGGQESVDEGDSSSLKLKEIEDLDDMLQKFETEKVSVPSPFIAYVNMKNVIDNLLNKKDTKLAEKLQDSCEKLWVKAQE